MSLTKTVSLFAGTTLALTGVAFGSTEANNPAGDALAQINELRAEIASLKAANGENWLTEQRAAEIKGLVQDVLADADTRASLQGGGSNAGYDNAFFVSSSDGNFRLNINGGASLRWSFNNRSFDVAPGAAEEENNWGFSAVTSLIRAGSTTSASASSTRAATTTARPPARLSSPTGTR
jgi:hypothetical protein